MAAFARAGIAEPWAHQAAAADLARSGLNVILATGTGSGKSVGYLAPALTAIGEGSAARYLAPTRALAADQLNLLHALGGQPARGLGLRPTVVDSDTPYHQRAWARRHATYLLTTPDMLHYGLLPQHQRWSGFLRRLRYVIIGECHGYRGVFGSHVAQVLRRLRRGGGYHQEPGSPDLSRARLGDDQRSSQVSGVADWPARPAGDRRRGAASSDDVRAVGTTAEHGTRSGRRAAAPGRGGRDRRPARRPGARRRSRPGLHQVTARRGGDGRGGTEPAGRDRRGRAGWPGCRLAPATCRPSGGNWRRRSGPARSRHWRQPPRSNSASTSPAWTQCSSRAGQGPGLRCGSRPGGRAALAGRVSRRGKHSRS